MSNKHVFNVTNGDGQSKMGFVGQIAERRDHLINNQFMSDIVFIVGEQKQRIYAHKLFLITASEFFTTMFTGGFKEASASEITLDDTDPTIFLEILRFIYSRTMNLTPENIHKICVLCEKYMLADGLEYASEFVVKSVTKQNVLKVLQQNRRFKFGNVDARCVDFIAENPMFYFQHEDINLLDRDSLEVIIKTKRINCSNVEILKILEEWQKSDEGDVAELKSKQVAELKTILENTPRSLGCNTLIVFGFF
ncbi:BTB/POZ domain-containing protein 2-like [Topomyia yanbarensis]|uniref:BTB/POZ domain-containing protein 2-like n=1 Tax=Topomyia yanbarensis TaxID=2498891 RepID=UPI00273CCA70|nr:BTB/POZ domain-containing protein 2-like [Topomyia yanbarensis]XP_058836309.1 BTB/POZ domain-containing protein 2-like [Topomyia yanbarensis]